MRRDHTSPSPLVRFWRWLGAPAQHYLLIGTAISLLLHAGALAWRFSLPASRQAPATSLEIVLLNAHTETPPAQAQVMAPQAFEGGGNASRGLAATPLPRTGDDPNTIVLDAMRKRQEQLEAEQTRLLTLLRADVQAGAERSLVHPWHESARPGEDLEEQPGVVQNAQIAVLADRVQAYNALPRRAFVAPSAQASPYAGYVNGWSRRVEAIGTRHYPDAARGRVYGTLRATVTVRADGSLAAFEIDLPSQHAVLNQAARRIVQLATPFAPFPPDMAREVDELVITRTWHFVNDKLETATP